MEPDRWLGIELRHLIALEAVCPPGLMRRSGASGPLVEVGLTELADDSELLGLVERGALDLTFADMPLMEGPFEVEELLRDPYVLLLPPDSPLAGRTSPPATREI